jgi:hypothetical protein
MPPQGAIIEIVLRGETDNITYYLWPPIEVAAKNTNNIIRQTHKFIRDETKNLTRLSAVSDNRGNHNTFLR